MSDPKEEAEKLLEALYDRGILDGHRAGEHTLENVLDAPEAHEIVQLLGDGEAVAQMSVDDMGRRTYRDHPPHGDDPDVEPGVHWLYLHAAPVEQGERIEGLDTDKHMDGTPSTYSAHAAPQPILHERDDDGNWICCCGDFLERERDSEAMAYLGECYSFCPECGPGVRVDEDGLCIGCGSTAMGHAVDHLRAILGLQEKE